MILRGGKNTNYQASDVSEVSEILQKNSLMDKTRLFSISTNPFCIHHFDFFWHIMRNMLGIRDFQNVKKRDF